MLALTICTFLIEDNQWHETVQLAIDLQLEPPKDCSPFLSQICYWWDPNYLITKNIMNGFLLFACTYSISDLVLGVKQIICCLEYAVLLVWPIHQLLLGVQLDHCLEEQATRKQILELNYFNLYFSKILTIWRFFRCPISGGIRSKSLSPRYRALSVSFSIIK